MADPARALAGKVILLTGATEGIGKAAAFAFARQGAHLTLVARNQRKGEALVGQLLALDGGGSVALELADLSRLDEVRGLARRFRAAHDRLDILANNAGAVFTERLLSPDGYELTFALDHLAYFVLTLELLPLIEQTEGSRIISTSSGAHESGQIDLATIARRPAMQSGYKDGLAAYCDAKLANVLFTRELARRLGPGPTATCFHPGFVRTGFGHNTNWFVSTLVKLGAALTGRSPEQGAETLIWLATSPVNQTPNGAYFMDCAVKQTAPQGRDDAMAKALWELSVTLTAEAK